MKRLLLLLCGLFYGLHTTGGGLPPMADEMKTVDAAHPTTRYDAEDLDRSSGDKFLLFEIVEVINPHTIPLAFSVHYHPPGRERIHLGGFALFPADNPGRFIVATQGKVERSGEVLLTLEPLEPAEGAQTVKVRLAPVRLIETLESP
jgi:hypothetical protein